MNVIISIIILIFSSNLSLVLTSKRNDLKLELVQVLFRHGDRIPTKVEVYKTDPYDPEFYEEPGYGQLTKTGMKREYKIGQILRNRYDNFLGEYKHGEVSAYSTEHDRTKMSLQLVLAGLYPPSPKTSWSNEINWSPIPTHFKPFDQDFLLLAVSGKCALWFSEMVRAAEKSPEIVKRFEKYNDFSKYIVNKTLITNKQLFTLNIIHNNLNSITSMGLPLPNWCTEEHYRKLQEIAVIAYDTFVYTEAMRQIAAGPIVEEFLKNINNSENGTEKRKIYLYGGHDLNIASFTRAHNVTDIPKIPTFGTAVILEKLRGRDNEVYIRMMLWTGVTETLITVKLRCGYVCLLSEYVKMVESVVPNDDVKHCMSSDITHGKVNTRKIQVNPAVAYSYLLAGNDLLSFKYGKEAFMQ